MVEKGRTLDIITRDIVGKLFKCLTLTQAFLTLQNHFDCIVKLSAADNSDITYTALNTLDLQSKGNIYMRDPKHTSLASSMFQRNDCDILYYRYHFIRQLWAISQGKPNT